MYGKNFQQRYGLYFEIFLNKIGTNLSKIYYDEDILMTNLQQIVSKQLDAIAFEWKIRKWNWWNITSIKLKCRIKEILT